MIATTIGRTFLNAWNSKYNKGYSAKEFFEKEFHQLFYDHPKYLQWIINSPFVQGLSASSKGEYGLSEVIKDANGNTLKFKSKGDLEEFIKTHVEKRADVLEIVKKSTPVKGIKFLKTLNKEERNTLLTNFHDKVDRLKRENFDGSIAIGFPASEKKKFETTSGMVSDISSQFESEDVYLSWIGEGLGVGVTGGYSILFDHPQILLTVYDGWKVYRRFLNAPTLEKLCGNKINSWNGQWLHYAYSRIDFEDNPDFEYLWNYGVFTQNEKLLKVNTILWSKLYLNLSEKLCDKVVTAYVYSFGKMNKTIGFIPFRFHQGRSILSIYKALFGENDALTQKEDYENLFGIHIKKACELGAIGLQALEPHRLREYFDKAKMPDYSTPKVTQKIGESPEAFEERRRKANQKDYENIISFRTYKTWLLAMITKNKQEDLHYSEEIAIALKEYRADARKTDRENLIKNDLLQAKTKKQFLDGLVVLIKDVDPVLSGTFKTLRDKVHLMTAEDFGYFVVLLKFDYAYQEKIS